MASPVDAGRAGTNVTTASDPWTVNLPGSIAAGDTLLMFIRAAGVQTVTLPTDWVEIEDWEATAIPYINNTSDASNDYTSIFWKKATGSEGATVSVDFSSTVKGAAMVYRITGAADPTVTAPVTSKLDASNGTGTGANGDPAVVTPAGGSADYLFIAYMGMDGEDPTQTLTAAPSGYSNFTAANSGTASTAGTNCIVGSGSKQATTSSENAGAFTSSSPSAGWSAVCVAVYPTAGGGTVNEETGSLVAGMVQAGADVFTAAETGALVADTTTPGADVYEASETGALVADTTLAGLDAATLNRLGALTTAALLSGADVFEHVETGSLVADTELSGVAEKTVGGVTYEKTGALVSATTVVGADVFEAAETGSLVADTTQAGADASTLNRLGVIVSGTTLSGADVFEHVESGSLVTGTTQAGADVFTAAETGSLTTSARHFGADVFTASETGSITTNGLLSGVGTTETGPVTYNKTGFLAAGGLFSGADVFEHVETGSLTAGTSLSGVNVIEYGETGALVISGLLAGGRVLTANRSGSVTTATFLSGVSEFISSLTTLDAICTGRIDYGWRGSLDGERGHIEQAEGGVIDE